MKTFLIFLLAACLAASAQAQAPAAPGAEPLPTPDELDQLLGPIALYPDSLIALILPASTAPSDIVLADRYLSGNGDPAQIPNQPWEDSVKALTHYPALLQWLDQNLDWTTQLGDAFVSEPAGVMDAIQQLRAQARAAGNLVDTAQQQVDVEDGDISIDQTDPNAIYMPEYDPDEVYDEGYAADAGPLILYGPACPAGAWLDYGIDWHHHGIYVGGGQTGSGYRGNVARGNAGIANARLWQPNTAGAQRGVRLANQGSRVVSRAKPLPGVTVPHGTRRTANVQSSAPATSNVSNPARLDFTGRGESRPSGLPAESHPAAPAVVSHEQAPRGGMFNEYRRGSEARDASARGELSRQSHP